MPKRRVRLLILLSMLVLPSCIVVTCGDSRTIPGSRGTQSPAAAPGATVDRDTTGGRF